MARTLSGNGRRRGNRDQNSNSPSIGDNSDGSAFIDFFDRYIAADNAVAAALGDRKSLRAEIKGAGLSLQAFDRVRKETRKSDDEREQQDRDFRRMMEWLRKPLGHQADWVDDGDAESVYSLTR